MLRNVLNPTFLAILVLPLCLSGENTAGTQYQKRLLGDKAFDSGLYNVAMDYYENYLRDASGDTPALRDAYYCLISTCLRSNNITEAKRLYHEVSTKFKQYYSNHPEDQRKLDFWEAQILLVEGKLGEANKIFGKLSKETTNSEVSDEISLNARLGEATSTLRMGNSTKARMLFLNLKDLASKKQNIQLLNAAIEEIIMIDLLNSNYKEAKLLISEASTDEKANTTKLDMLNIYALVSENNIKEAQAIYDKIRPMSLGPDQLWYFITYSLAAGYIKNSQPEKAMGIIDDAFALAPDMPDKEQITILKINNFITLHKYEQAISVSKMFLDTFPNSNIRTKILLTLSESLIKGNNFSEVGELADKYFLFLPADDPDVLTLAELFGKNALELKQYDNAKDFFDYIVLASKDSTSTGNAKYWNAEIDFYRKNYVSAIAQYESIEKNYPFLKENSLYKKSQIYIAQDKYAEAARILGILLTEFPSSKKLEPSPLFMYAAVLEKNGDYHNAIEQFTKYSETDSAAPDASKGYYEAGNCSLIIQKPEMAAEYFEKVVNNYKGSDVEKDALYKLVYTNLLLYNFDKAAKYAEWLFQNYPLSDNSIQAQFWLANYYRTNKQFNEAIKKLQAIINITNDSSISSKAYYEQASVYFSAGNNAKATETLQTLQTKYTDSKVIPASYFLEGDILASAGKYEDAISSYKQAANKVVDDEDLLLASAGRIGDCYLATLNYAQDRKGAINQAISSYESILGKKNLSNFMRTQTLYKLGKSYEFLGNTEKAIEVYHEAFYSNAIRMEQNANPSKIWMVKSAIALTRLLQEKNTPEGARAAIEVLEELIKFNVEPVTDFQLKIDEIKSLYKLKE